MHYIISTSRDQHIRFSRQFETKTKQIWLGNIQPAAATIADKGSFRLPWSAKNK